MSETDAQAVAEYEPHVWYYARNLLKNRDTFNAPPGHSSIGSLMGMLERRRGSRPGSYSTWEEIVSATGLGTLVPNFSVGAMSDRRPAAVGE